MVQPAICINGKWQALGQVSPKTSTRITMEVNKLWDIRQRIIYRDLDIANIFPDYVKMATGVDPSKVDTAGLSKSPKKGTAMSKLGEYAGEEYPGEEDQSMRGYNNERLESGSKSSKRFQPEKTLVLDEYD